MYKPSNFLEKINLHFKIYIPRLENKSILAVSQNRRDLFEMAPEVMAVKKARQKLTTSSPHPLTQEQVTPDNKTISNSLAGPCPFFLSCFLSHCPIHSHLSFHCLFPFSPCDAIPLPYLVSACLPPSLSSLPRTPAFLSHVMNPFPSFPLS